jgi:FkbM family methyltransferase
MKRLVNLVRATRRDAPIVGYSKYLAYRFRSFRGVRSAMRVEVEGQSILVRPGTPDLRVAFQSLRREFDILEALLPRSFSGIVVDAGGYIGAAAIKLSSMFPNATIVTIEPSAENFEVLKHNIVGFSNIHPVMAALYVDNSTSVPLVDRGTGEWGFSIAVDETVGINRKLGSVSTITLLDIKSMFPGREIGLIKLDIEGGEYELLKNPSEVLRNTPVIFAELHDRIVSGCSEAFMAFSQNRWVVDVGGEKLLSLSGKPNWF